MGRCTACAAGKYSLSRGDVGACVDCSAAACDAGKELTGCGGASKGACKACPAGKFSPDGTPGSCADCAACGTNEYRTMGAQTSEKCGRPGAKADSVCAVCGEAGSASEVANSKTPGWIRCNENPDGTVRVSVEGCADGYRLRRRSAGVDECVAVTCVAPDLSGDGVVCKDSSDNVHACNAPLAASAVYTVSCAAGKIWSGAWVHQINDAVIACSATGVTSLTPPLLGWPSCVTPRGHAEVSARVIGQGTKPCTVYSGALVGELTSLTAAEAGDKRFLLLRMGETCAVGCRARFGSATSQVACALDGDAVVCTCDGGDCAKLRTMCADDDEVKCNAYAFANGITTSPLQPSCSDGIVLTTMTRCHLNCEPVE